MIPRYHNVSATYAVYFNENEAKIVREELGGWQKKILFNTSNAVIFPGTVQPNKGETDL